MENEVLVGAVIEDAHISAGLVDLKLRQIIPDSFRRKRINPKGEKSEIIDGWSSVIDELIKAGSLADPKVGIGILSPINYTTGLFLSDNKERYGSLYLENIKDLLAAKLALSASNFCLINDAVSFFQGEVFAGAVRGYKKSFGITLGLGLGAASYEDGVVKDADLWNKPFKDGIAEDYLSSKFLTARFKELSGIEVSDLVELKRFSPDRRVEQVFLEFSQNLAAFIAEIIKIERPEVFLIGGYMESSNRFFFDNTKNLLRDNNINTPVMKAILGEKAGILGAASSWYNESLLHI